MTVSTAPTTLNARFPIPRSPIIGRAGELQRLRDLFRDHDFGVVTLTGPGGVGKTRLAIEFGRTAQDLFPDGIVFVPLANVSDPDRVGPAIAGALGIASTGDELEPAIADFLSDRVVLLILDNFEQVIASAPFVATYLDAAPKSRVLTTSRSALRIRGEHEFPVTPLALAPEQESEQSGAVALFVARAAATVPGFGLTSRNAETIAQICARLDGLPLAIELAAARLKVLTPEELLTRLDRSLTVLSGGARDAPERQQTLRNAIAWSYELLKPFEQWLFRQLAVFAGGMTFESVEGIGAELPGYATYNGDLLDGLTALMEQSLLRRVDVVDGESRIVMLNTIREYALEQLTEHSEAAATRAAHAAYYFQQLDSGEQALKTQGPLEVEAMAWFDREHDNIRAAIAYYEAGNDNVDFLQIVLHASRFWTGRLGLRELRAWVERGMAMPGALPSDVELGARFSLAWISTFLGEHERAQVEAERAFELATELGAREEILRIRNILAGIAVHRNDLDAAWIQYTDALHESRGERITRSFRHNLGLVAMIRGDIDGAGSIFRSELEAARANDDRFSEALSTVRLAQIAVMKGQFEEAARLDRVALETLWEARHFMQIAEVAANEAVLADIRGDIARADELAEYANAVTASVEIFDIQVSNPMSDRYLAIEARLPKGRSRYRHQPTLEETEAIVRGIFATPLPVASEAPVFESPLPTAEATELTTRELDIVRCIAQGRTNQEIADELFISIRTVQTHVSNILTKLELSSRAAVAAYAVRRGIS